jgi:hypothetical protein
MINIYGEWFIFHDTLITKGNYKIPPSSFSTSHQPIFSKAQVQSNRAFLSLRSLPDNKPQSPFSPFLGHLRCPFSLSHHRDHEAKELG